MDIDTTNQFAVGSTGDSVVMLRLPVGRLTKAEALNLAAYLVVCSLCIEGGATFEEVLAAVKAT